jgi:hypothetical protein
MNMSDGILVFLTGFYVLAKASARNIIRHRFTSCLELRIDVEIYQHSIQKYTNTAQKFINQGKAKLWCWEWVIVVNG